MTDHHDHASQSAAAETADTGITPVETQEAMGLGSEASIGLLEQMFNTATSAWLASMNNAFGSLNAMVMSMPKITDMLSASVRSWSPDIGMNQEGDKLLVSADLPGYAASDLHVEIRDGQLLVSGQRTDTQGSSRAMEHFETSLLLPQAVDSQRIDADLSESGHLKITLPIKNMAPQPSAMQ